jgi:two-component system NtrC family sensor kinase
MGIVSTIPQLCRRCYTCVRECPAKAIKVISGQATVIAELCIACGNCVKVCTQKAKRIEDSTMLVKHMLDGGGRVFACLAPSFPVAFPQIHPGKIISAVRALGFTDVWETAFGAELVAREYARLAKKAIKNGTYVIATPCPAIVGYVGKFMPKLREALAPIASPMIAAARAIKDTFGKASRVVFIGPCIAKKAEIKDPFVQGTVDAVLTFEEFAGMLDAAAVDVEALSPGGFDSPPCYLGRSIPISGGLGRAVGLDTDILQNSVIVTEGKDRVMAAFRELAEGKSKARIFDVLLCEGCINGPKMSNSMSMFARKEMLADYINEQNRFTVRKDLKDTAEKYAGVDLSREFSEQAAVLPQPSEAEIEATLKLMRKFTAEDRLNCGSCGYPSCREKAVAVCQGLAEVGMCLPYLVEELESTLATLQRSHQAAQDRLLKTERLASMGQISAGVAHEINNPLSTILLYSHMLLKAHREGDAESEDLQMIVNEANRCRYIMRGLLDFARQSRVVKAPTDLRALILDAVDSLASKSGGIKVTADVHEELPAVMADAEQLRQMLVNLVQNGIDAVEAAAAQEGAGASGASDGAGASGVSDGAGASGVSDGAGASAEVSVSAGVSVSGDCVVLRVRDTGCGMPPEVLKEIFTPFFTTKQLGQGTGVGLSIVYGVVKMHSGDISVDSEPGKGAIFNIRLPIGEKSKEEIHEIG